MDGELLGRFKELFSTLTGLNFRQKDESAIMRHISARIKSKGLSSEEDYLAHLTKGSPALRIEREELIKKFTTGESYFFRDKGLFELLASVIIPEVAGKASRERVLRIWSAGCAAGEEPYSIAIMFKEMFSSLTGWNVQIIATDLRHDFIEKAKAGLYGEWSFRSTQKSLREKWFRQVGGQWEIKPEIKKYVSFSVGDLFENAFPSNMDLIICRNVLIYYSLEGGKKITGQLTGALREAGYLITGHGELFTVETPGLVRKIFPESVVYQKVTRKLNISAPQSSLSFTQYFPVVTEPAVIKQATAAPVAEKTPVPQPPPAVDELRVLIGKGAYKAAIKKADLILSSEPNNFGVLYYAALASANTGGHAKARDYIDLAIQISKLAAEPHYLLAHIAEELGAVEEAKDELKKVIYLKPSFIPAYLDLAALHDNGGQWGMAVKMRRAALDILKNTPGETIVEPYDGMTCCELIKRVEKMLEF